MRTHPIWSFAFFLLLNIGLNACKKADSIAVPVNNTIPIGATLTGQQEKPKATLSMATGTFNGIIDPASRTLSYTLTYSGLSPTAGHLHRIDPQKGDGTGPVDIPLGVGLAFLTSPVSGTAGPLLQTKIDSMVNGFYYANLHTTAYPNGEIRGDIRVK